MSFAYQHDDANLRSRTVLADGAYWFYENNLNGQF